MGTGHKKNVPGCKCCDGYSIPGCACPPPLPPSWDLHWAYWGYDPIIVDFAVVGYVQREYPNDSPLTFHDSRPEYTKAGFDPDNPTTGSYNEWGPGWYSGLIDHDVSGRPNGSVFSPPAPLYYFVWFLRCDPGGFTLTSPGNCCGSTSRKWDGSNGPALPFVLSGGVPAGYTRTYAAGPNTCRYGYLSAWSGGPSGHPDDGQEGRFKNGSEWILVAADPAPGGDLAMSGGFDLIHPGGELWA